MHHLTMNSSSSMKVGLVGVGAMGGWIGAHLAADGRTQVSALARGATLQALQAHGLTLQHGEQRIHGAVRASDQPQELGPQDVLIIAVKGPALPRLVASLAPMVTPSTLIVPAMNGVPWWFCHGQPGFEGGLPSVDPHGLLTQSLPHTQVLGCVLHASAAVSAPGMVQLKLAQALIVGEPSGRGADTDISPRVQRVVDVLKAAGLPASASADIRKDIWYKLWGNLTMNPVSALTGATIDQVLADPLTRELCARMMAEARSIGERIGCHIEQSIEDRHAITAKLGAFKTSMLQDVEAGREIELDAIVGAVHEIARRLNEPAPAIDAIFGLTRLFARPRGLYPS
jgi:2-dehydropantoate 2-reductase